MLFNIGDLVTRNSYHNDIVFEITEIEGDIAVLRGVDVRLLADSVLSDLVKVSEEKTSDDDKMLERFSDVNLDRNQYFYMPGRVIHLDSDKSFLDRCIKFYDSLNIKSKGIKMKEIKPINYIASFTLGIYLFHDHIDMRKFLWITLFKNASFAASPLLILYSILPINYIYHEIFLYNFFR